MPRRRTARTRSEGDDEPLVFGCVADPVGRSRIKGALNGAAVVRWFNSFVDLREALELEPRHVMVVVVDVVDPTGASADGFARGIADYHAGVGVVAYRKPAKDSQADVCQLGAAGVHDVLIAGHTDEGHTAKTIILNACRRGAADLVMTELQRILPTRLHPFADAAVRHPSKRTVGALAQHLSVHRQTPNVWCKAEKYVNPEELLVWCRLLLVAALLELTCRTLDSIADELEYASATSLRNQLRSYTHMTATKIRESGMSQVVELFAGRVAQHKRDGSARKGAGDVDSGQAPRPISLD